MNISTILVVVCVIFFYLILPTILFLFIKKKKLLNRLFICFFALFSIILIVCTIGQIDISKDITSLNFNFSYGWCNKRINWLPYTKSLVDFLINVAMLFPVGLSVFAISKRKTWQKLLLCLAIGALCGLAIETYQFILPIQRSVQLSDIILNALSALIGGLYAWLIFSIKEKTTKHKSLDVDKLPD